MGSRFIPTFIERGVGYPVRLKNWRWVDLSSLSLFFLFWTADLLAPNTAAVALLAVLLFALHGVRLVGWHTPGLWNKPLQGALPVVQRLPLCALDRAVSGALDHGVRDISVSLFPDAGPACGLSQKRGGLHPSWIC